MSLNSCQTSVTYMCIQMHTVININLQKKKKPRSGFNHPSIYIYFLIESVGRVAKEKKKKHTVTTSVSLKL